MKKGTTWLVAVISTTLCGAPADAAGSVSRACPPVRSRPERALEKTALVQLAILLDTSNSMDGLIDQARSQLWSIVNQFAAARRYGQAATLQVALYEYGNSRLAPQGGYVRRLLPFTTDLDRVSQELFALTTQGGDEFCGTVLQAALDQLAWSASPAALEVVFIAGNEPFTQGPVDFRRVSERAARAGITVNTIHCGPREEGLRTGWSEGARLAYGSYLTIDQDKTAEHIEAPQDDPISRLGLKLNDTYLPFGAQGRAGQERQAAQDKNALGSGAGSATSRAVTKANRLYSNSGWDLVDAVVNGGVDVKALKTDELPKELQGRSADEIRAAVLERAEERARLQAEINRLNVERQKFIGAERRKTGTATALDTFDAVVTEALRHQAACKEIELQ